MAEDTEKVELLNPFFASVLTAGVAVRNPRPWQQETKPGEIRTFHWSRRIGLELI